MSDTTLGDLTNSSDANNNPHSKKAQALTQKTDNSREVLKSRENFENKAKGHEAKLSKTNGRDTEKENTNVTEDNDVPAKPQDRQQNPPNENSLKLDENLGDELSGVLTERRNQNKYIPDEEEEDSPEENEEDEEDEKENAMNKLKALLGSAKQKKKPQSTSHVPSIPGLRKASSFGGPDNNSLDFIYVIEKMKRDLFNKLDIKIPSEDDDEDNDEISKIFYEGRDGQEYTVSILQQFFDVLKHKAKHFIHQYESFNDQSKKKIKEEPQEEKKQQPEDKRESDKERIKRKLNENKKKMSSKDDLKSLLGTSKAIKKEEPKDIRDIIKVDSQVLNYGTVNPGKLLGSILVITNTSESEQTVELSIDTKNDTYDREEVIKNKDFEYLEELTNEETELTEKELEECLTEEKKTAALDAKKKYIPNSESKYDCWFIENPKTKDLTK